MTFGTAWIDHSGEFSLDMGDYDKCPAEYQMRVKYYRGRVDELTGCTLQAWFFSGRKQTRQTAVDLVGEDEVKRQEDLVAQQFWEGEPIAAE